MELDWADIFPIELGSYITINRNIVLWKSTTDCKEELYHFSARSETCCKRFYTKRSINLIDFRYATLILEDFQCAYKSITDICMFMKQFAYNEYCAYITYVIDGIIIPAKNGIHIILFDINCVEEGWESELLCSKSDTPAVDIKLLEPGPVKLSRDIQTRFFVVNGLSSNPVNIEIPEGSIYGANIIETINVIKLRMLGFRHNNNQYHSRRMAAYRTLLLNDHYLPVYGSFIELPENTVLFRGYDTNYPSISDRPAYFGDHDVAEEYANTSSTHDIGYFASTRSLNIIDIRFLKVLLKDLLEGYSGNVVKKASVAFGLCSLYHQLRLMKDMYADAISKNKELGYKAMLSKLNITGEVEQSGIRVAETSNDGWVMVVLREVFDGIADGFISPELHTFYQSHTNNKLHPELIIFNPLKSGIVELNKLPHAPTISVSELIRDQYPAPIVLQAYSMKTSYIGCGRTRKHKRNSRHTTYYNHKTPYIPAIEAFNNLLNRGDSNAIRQYNEAINEGKKLRKQVIFSHSTPKNPEFPTRAPI